MQSKILKINHVWNQWIIQLYTECPKKKVQIEKNHNILSTVGPNFTMYMPWEGLILLSLSKKQPKNIFQTQGCRLLVIQLVHRGSNNILLVNFFRTLQIRNIRVCDKKYLTNADMNILMSVSKYLWSRLCSFFYSSPAPSHKGLPLPGSGCMNRC